MKVMWAMLARLDYENLIQVSQAEVAQELGMNRHNVNRSIKKLIELGVVLEGVRIGISLSYRLNPNFGWKGSAKGHRGFNRPSEASEVAKPVAAAASSAQTPQQRADAAAYTRTLVYMFTCTQVRH